MKKFILLILILAFCGWLNSWGYYGQFYNGTGARDSVWMAVNTFDTLGQCLNADTVVWIRFYRTTLVDSTIVTGAGTRTGYYLTGKRAFDGTNYGEYTVDIRWKVQGKNFKKAESYTVFPDSVNKVGTVRGNVDGSVASVTAGVTVTTNNDKINYQLATGQVIARVDSVTAVGRINTNLDKISYQLASGQVIARADSVTGLGRLSTNLDKINYQLASGQVVARADSVTGVGRINTNLDKTGYGLTTAYLTKADSTSAGASYLRAKYIEDKIGYRLSAQGQADIWINDTTGENSGWAQFFKGRLDANVSTRSTLIASDNIGINWADITNPSTVQSLIGTRIKYVDSLGEEIAGGSATNPDTIANHVWIWNTRTLTSGVGTGANQVVITTKQSSDSTPIASVQVQVLNYEQTATAGLLTTNPSGQATFALDNAIYKVRMFKPGWQFTVPESLVVSGNSSATLYASAFDPGLPPSAELCRVYGWIKDLKGLPVVGAVIDAKIVSTPLRYQSVLISPYYKTTNTDSEGYWYLDLYPNSKLSPSSTQYDFTIYIPYGTILKLKSTVPEQSSWELQW
ncbi:MAG: hypothetical protein V1890_00055 [Candidatus Zixiibacteriota bacterium]